MHEPCRVDFSNPPRPICDDSPIAVRYLWCQAMPLISDDLWLHTAASSHATHQKPIHQDGANSGSNPVQINITGFILSQKTSSSGPSPLGDNRLCRVTAASGRGMMECWNAGFSGVGSVFITMARISLLNQTVIRFWFPIFHYSTIPLFHSEATVNSTPLVSDSLLYYRLRQSGGLSARSQNKPAIICNPSLTMGARRCSSGACCEQPP